MSPSWTTAFWDFPEAGYDEGVRFWRAVTGYGISASRGDHGQFATLEPPLGDAHLRVQRLDIARPRLHLDLHVAWPRISADRAKAMGAREIADLGHVVMASPGGFVFCFVPERGEATPAPAAEWPGDHRSQVDQVCLDVPSQVHARELEFWEWVTARELESVPGRSEFHRLRRGPDETLHLLVQRLDEPLGAVRAHVDVATTDRAAETARHQALGATVVDAQEWWTVLTDPLGSAYCLVDRRPR